MYSLRLFLRDDDGTRPFKIEPLSAADDDDAIKLGTAQIWQHKPENYALVEARVCRDDHIIWSRSF
jgi:hypothetical protein